MKDTSRNTARAAQALASEGRHVLACHGIIDGTCTCGVPDCASPGKHPLLRRGLHQATTDPSVIRRWWDRWPGANLGIRTGAISGLMVLDIDPPEGLESLERLNRVGRGLPPTTTVRTGSGGLHLYFEHPGVPIANRASSVLGPGIDVRGDGGYVIAPPSTHTSGQGYEWEYPTREPHLPPTWLTALLVEEAEPRPPAVDVAPTRVDSDVSAWAHAALDRETQRVIDAQPGHRNHALNRSAFVLGQIVGGGHLDRDSVRSILQTAGQSTGLGERETHRTVESGLSAGERSPRHPLDRAHSGIDPPQVGLPDAEEARPAPSAEIEL